MSFPLNEVGLSTSELLEIDRAEALAYEALYTASAEKLGTGSARIGDSTAIWYPDEDEAGYNCIVNFHLAADLDATYSEALKRITSAGSRVFGIPVDERISRWATPLRLASLGLSHESNENIWALRLDPSRFQQRPEPPSAFTIASLDIAEDELAKLINLGWDLEAGDARGALFSSTSRLPEWKTYLARAGREIAAIAMFCSYENVGILMLAVVLPAFRGRGLQSYFIADRLFEAAARGCTLAMSETDDDNASPRNLQRAGFRPCVRRSIYSRRIA